MFSFVDKYVTLAGRGCCCGRSWVGLDRSLARHADDPEYESPSCVPSDGPERPFVEVDREPARQL
jgi:hypothetical protein